MAKVNEFVQREPNDGMPSSERTEAYLGYDRKNLYVAFVCFDTQPNNLRWHLSRREDIFDDDTVEVMLDTFHDERRAYVFQANPLGVQWDGIYSEAIREETTDYSHFDDSWDTVWSSWGKVTSSGFVVLMAIPFKSLRFSPAPEQAWGIILNRTIPRTYENNFWPAITHRVQGRLNQAATMVGLEGVSPGRNMQFIPYGILRSFRSPDLRDANAPRFSNKDLQGQLGLDSKFILKDSLVLDLTANPDFSQVESDEPQVTVNQRFEVLFPEKRPFFLENGDYFKTPINLLFTRRIIDPQAGARLTGRVGNYSLGMFAVDDRGPGRSVADFAPNFRQKAYFGIMRVTRDLYHQSNLGFIYTDREFNGAFNRIGGLDTTLKLKKNWTLTGQAVASSTRNNNGSYQAGPAYKAELQSTGLHFNYDLQYNDISPNFVTEPGFVPRVDEREILQFVDYTFRPNSGPIISWGPHFYFQRLYGHDGTFLDGAYSTQFNVVFKGQTDVFWLPYNFYPEQLRPADFPSLREVTAYNQHLSIVGFDTSHFKEFTIHFNYSWGPSVNYVPPSNIPPVLERYDSTQTMVTLRPSRHLKIENTYLFSRLLDRPSDSAVFNNHIIRSKWNYQITRALSVRLIPQYTALLANPNFTSLQTTKQFNVDFLITYLLHPNTAIYVGYNSDLQNMVSPLGADENGQLLRSRDRLINDGRQFFVKVSYLFRF